MAIVQTTIDKIELRKDVPVEGYVEVRIHFHETADPEKRHYDVFSSVAATDVKGGIDFWAEENEWDFD